MTTTGGISKREFLIFLYKYRLRLVLAFIIPFALAVAISFVPVPKYKASSVLIVRMGSEYVYQPEVGNSGAGPAPTIPLTSDQIFKSEVAILSSADLHRQVIEKIGIGELFPSMLHPGPISLAISDITNRIADVLASFGVAKPEPKSDAEIQKYRLAKAVDMFDKRFDIQLEKDSAVISMSFEHEDFTVAQQTLDALVKFYFEKRRQLYMEPRSQLAASELSAKKEQAAAAGRAVEAYKRKYNIHSLPDQRAELLRQRDQLQQQSLSINNAQLNSQIGIYNRQLDQLDAYERELTSLQKQADIANDAYSLFSNKYNEAKAHDNLQSSRADSVRLIQPATVQAEPKRLQSLIIVGGFFLSLLCVLLVAALTEFSRSGFLAPEQIERSMGLPVLAVIPYDKRRF